MQQLQQPQIVAQFEACCVRLETATEELMAFRRDPHALEWARQVIDQSSMASAQFQAIAAMRDVILTRWTQLAEEEKVRHRDYLFQVASSSSSNVAVARGAWGAYADVWARGTRSSGWSGTEAVGQCSHHEIGLRALMTSMAESKEHWQRDGIAACGQVAFEAFLSGGRGSGLASDVVSWDWDGTAPGWWRSHLGSLVEKATTWYREHAAAELRDLLVSLSCVKASAFGGDLGAFRTFVHTRLPHITEVLFTVGLMRRDDHTPDFCGAAAAMARCAVGEDEDGATRPFSHSARLLDLLRSATKLVIERGELTGEPMTALLQAWEASSSLLAAEDARVYVDFANKEIEYQTSLAVEEMTLEHDADLDPSDEEDSERYAMVSAIGRADANVSAAFLGARIDSAAACLPGAVLDAKLEEMRCCVELATELLTDDEFRYAEVPIALERFGQSVVGLVSAVTRLADKDFLSPPVAASLAHFLSRFTATYLESDFADGAFRNKRMADTVALCAARWLNAYPTEPSVVQRSLRVVAALSASRGGRPLEGIVLGGGGGGAALLDAWLEALLSARVSSLDSRAELYGVCADLCLSKHVLCGGGAEPFEKKIAGQIVGVEDDEAYFVLLGGVARATAAQSVRAPNGTEPRAEEARRAPADLVCRGLVDRSSSSRSTALLSCCRDVAVNQLAYARPETRATFLRLLPSLIAKSYDEDNSAEDDDSLRVSIELVEAVLADGLLCDEPLENARSAIGTLRATLPRVDANALTDDLETARRFYEALGSLASLADHEPLPVDFAGTILQALVFGAELPDGDAARAALRAARDLASSDALAAPHTLLLYDSLPKFLKPLLTTDTPANDRMEDAADAVLFFLCHLYNQHGGDRSGMALCNGLALSITSGSPAASRLAADIHLLLRSAPLKDPKLRKLRRDFQKTFADFVSSTRGYLVANATEV